MNAERYRERNEGPDPQQLTAEELKQGWHFCGEFDGLLTQGECFKEDGVTCICGFNRFELGETKRDS
jgi:hypothetical protein